jgi:hypothetical protein
MAERRGMEAPAIDVERCRAVLATCLPAPAGRVVRRIGQGWDSVVVLVDDDLVVRFPKRAYAIASR